MVVLLWSVVLTLKEVYNYDAKPDDEISKSIKRQYIKVLKRLVRIDMTILKKKKTILGMVIAGIILGGIILGLTSKDFMLRLAVFSISPRSAVTMEYEYYKELPENYGINV